MAKQTGKQKRAFVLTIAGTALLVWLLIAFTPLRRTIPGYPSAATRQEAIDNRLKIDSLEKVIETWEFQVGNIRKIVAGEPVEAPDTTKKAITE